ncbi:MAG TPA: carboxypeptidase-like regulatory domain-containing protein [Polyangiaceae bacterium]|nr:carboxypeptidase-like regulatory domain-containing protein [Polyangiaceae bacterium]
MDVLPGESAPAAPAGGTGQKLLSRRMLWICVGLSILVFFLWEGPSWRHADAADAAAWWSYAVIPPLVVGALLFERKLRALPLVLATVEVTAWKFFATYCFAQTMWMIFPPVTPPRALAPPAADEVRLPDPSPTVIDPRETGVLEGRVAASAGSGEGVLVYIDGGLERHVFGPPADVIRIVEEGGGITTSSEVAQVGQRVEARSGDLKLHTLIASTSEGDAFSIPLQSSGAWSNAKLRPFTGVAILHCGVHQRSGESRRLVITANPFFTKTDTNGAFRLAGVPAGRVHVTALGEATRSAGVDAVVEPGATTSISLAF